MTRGIAFAKRVARRKVWVAIAAAIVVAGAWVSWGEIAEHYAYGFEKITVSGVPNAGHIAPHLYRGGQPTDAGLEALRSLGVDTIISFTLEGEGAHREAAAAHALGLDYVHLPWSANGVPPPDDVERFLELANSPSRVVFVHCKSGSDRTGAMVALYRVLSDGWPVARALEEMDAFGYEAEFHPQLRAFVATSAANHPRRSGVMRQAGAAD